jgi:hypothetical protein
MLAFTFSSACACCLGWKNGAHCLENLFSCSRYAPYCTSNEDAFSNAHLTCSFMCCQKKKPVHSWLHGH